MMEYLPNLELLKPYRDDKRKSFEELCFQLVFEEYGSQGTLTSIDDSGGGDGVEFYITRPNGDVLGWQCKFIGRLSEGGAKEQIKKSLQKACDVHGSNLKEWVLCSKLSFTPDEKKWFDHTLPSSKKGGRPVIKSEVDVKLRHWGDSDILNLLRKNQDIRAYFFNDNVLDFGWFESSFQRVLDSSVVKSKYLNDLHITSDTDDLVIQTLFDYRLADVIEERKQILNVDRFLEEYEKGIESIRKEENIYDFKNDYHKIRDFILAKDRPSLIRRGNEHLNTLQDLLRKQDSIRLEEELSQVKIYREELSDMYICYSDLRSKDELSEIHWDVENEENDYKKREKIKKCRDTALATYSCLRNYIDAYEGIFHCLDQKGNTHLHIAGGASKGKTHLALNIVEHQIGQGLPAVFLFGKDFKSDTPIREQIVRLLDLPRSWSFSSFLSSFNVAGRVNKTKAILLIDGLNEAYHWKRIWDSELESIIIEVEDYANILFITTYRESYEEVLFPEGFFRNSKNWDKKLLVEGFNGDNLSEAIDRYFEFYNITLQNRSSAINHFSEPLYLKIFCETKKNQTVSFQNEDLFDVFDQYIAQANTNIINKLGLSSRLNKAFLTNKLQLISELLWQGSEREIPLDKVVPEILSEDELISIEGEDLLIFRDWNDNEVVTFTYDLLSGYLIAKSIFNQIDTSEDLLVTISGTKFTHELLTEEYLHPLYSDAIRCFSVLAVKKFGLGFYSSINNNKLERSVLDSLFEINTEILSQQEILVKEIVTNSFSNKKNRERIFSLFENTEYILDHPLNFDFLSDLLFELSVAERDLSWTEYIRKGYNKYSSANIEEFIDGFDEACRLHENSERIHLAARKVLWLLASTNRDMRDLATKALYNYGIKYNLNFLNLVEYSLSINDPYVSERSLAALYGVVMSCHNAKEFRSSSVAEFGKLLYGLMFSEDAPFSTTHILSRDYARRIIDIILLHDSTLLSPDEIANISPPYSFGGLRNFSEVVDETANLFAGPMRMDFSNYTIGHIVKDGHGYNDPPEKVKVRNQILWRIHDLGWNNELFENVEERIERSDRNFNRSKRATVERYGKKYSWIAYFEVAGLRDDFGLLQNDWEEFRFTDADIDPSFPVITKGKEFVTQDLLGDKKLSLNKWYREGGMPNLNKYLEVNFSDETGKWVCLDGFIVQKDGQIGREVFAFIRSFLIQEEDYFELVNCLNKQRMGGRWLPEKHSNHYTFHGELYTFEQSTCSNFVDLKFEKSRRTVKIKKGEPDYYPTVSFVNTDDGFVIKHDSPDEIEREVVDTVDFNVLMPVMDYSWEGSSTINEAGGTTVLGKEIANHLNLYCPQQTFDLVEIENDSKASKNINFHSDYSNNHSFVYLRKDLLDTYLSDKKMRLVHVIWGERDINFESTMKRDKFFEKYAFTETQVFQKVVDYHID